MCRLPDWGLHACCPAGLVHGLHDHSPLRPRGDLCRYITMPAPCQRLPACRGTWGAHASGHCRDYRWMDYPGQAKPKRHPQDASVQTYRGHHVLRTLMRARFSPAHSTAQSFIYTGSFDGSMLIYGLPLSVLAARRARGRDTSYHRPCGGLHGCFTAANLTATLRACLHTWRLRAACPGCLPGWQTRASLHAAYRS